jgi:hypothetical protein
MRNFRGSVGIVVTLALLAPLRDAAPAPTPQPTPGGAAVKKPSPDELPRCDDLRLTGDQMTAAFRKHAEESGNAPEGQAAFDAIGEELGCQWPWSDEEGVRRFIQLLEKAAPAPGRPRSK